MASLVSVVVSTTVVLGMVMVKLGAAVLFSTLGMETVTVLIAVAGLAVLLLASFSSSVPLAVVGGVVRDRFTFELAYTGMAIEGVEAASIVPVISMSVVTGIA